jgi:hypothetical protein
MSKRKANGGLSNFRKKPNIFSLQSFGHTLRDSATPPTARAGNLSADGRRADVQFVPLRQESHRGESSDQPANQDNEDDWQDLPGETTGFVNFVTAPRKRKWYASTVSFFSEYLTRVLIALPRMTTCGIGWRISETRTYGCWSLARAPWGRRACALVGRSRRGIAARSAMA